MVHPSSIKINEVEFFELRDIIVKVSGIMFSEHKKYLIENRLSKRLIELALTSFKEYINYLKSNPKREAEIVTLINLVTINETYFMRERGQVDYLVSTVMPALIAQNKKNIRIWSIPCSTGEEPYSIAIELYDAGFFSKATIEVIATDINSDVVEAAKHGVYREGAFRSCSQEFISKHFTQQGSDFIISNNIKNRVKFNVGNIVSDRILSLIGKVDIIFCRNVLIYFDFDNKKVALTNFKNILNPDGYLFLGHSESVSRVSTDFVMNNFGTGIVYTKKQ